MNRVILFSAILLLSGACKKDEDKTALVTKAYLIGVWNLEKYERHNLPSDTIEQSELYITGSYTWTFRSDDTAIIYQAGTPSTTTYFTYYILNNNGKNIIATRELGANEDDLTLQIKKFDLPYMECDNKEALTTHGDKHYDKYYLKKQ